MPVIPLRSGGAVGVSLSELTPGAWSPWRAVLSRRWKIEPVYTATPIRGREGIMTETISGETPIPPMNVSLG